MRTKYGTVVRNALFRRLFVGRIVTNAGDSIYFVAAMWLAFELGGSSFYTGLAGALTLAPRALQFVVGPIVDRRSKRRVLVVTQLAQAAFVLAVPVAVLADRLTVHLLLVVMPTIALLNQFYSPVKNAMLPGIVDEEHLVEANSLFSVADGSVDLLFTAAGGALLAVVSAATLFVADSATFVLAALLFAGIRFPDKRTDGSSTDYLATLREGFGYVRGTSLVWMLGVPVAVNLGTGVVMGVFPVYASLFSGPSTYGLFLATVSGGLLVGSLVASSTKRMPIWQLHVFGFLAGGGLWLVGVWIHRPLPTAGLFFLAWIPVGVTNVLYWTVLQTYVPDDLIGRVASVSTSVSVAAMPVGSLVGGVVGEVVGVVPVVASVGGLFLVASAYWYAHPLLRALPAVHDIDSERHGFTTG